MSGKHCVVSGSCSCSTTCGVEGSKGRGCSVSKVLIVCWHTCLLCVACDADVCRTGVLCLQLMIWVSSCTATGSWLTSGLCCCLLAAVFKQPVSDVAGYFLDHLVGFQAIPWLAADGVVCSKSYTAL